MNPPPPFAVEAENLAFAFGPETLFSGLSFRGRPGELTLVRGRSGRGKTTLLNILCGLLPPAAGGVRVLGRALAALAPDELRRLRADRIGYALQTPVMIPALTLRENLLLPDLFRRAPADPARLQQQLEALDLAEAVGRKPHQLSSGQIRRATLVRALIHRPPLALLDEPFNDLDDASATQAAALVRDYVAGGGHAVVVSHEDLLAPAAAQTLDMAGYWKKGAEP